MAKWRFSAQYTLRRQSSTIHSTYRGVAEAETLMDAKVEALRQIHAALPSSHLHTITVHRLDEREDHETPVAPEGQQTLWQ